MNLLTNISSPDIIYRRTIYRDPINIWEVIEMYNLALTEAVYYILLSLTQPMHGYGIIQNVEQLSNGRVRLAAGTLYGAIGNLLEKGWIIALPEEKGSRKKEYLITDTGKRILRAELERLKELIENGNRILGV